MNILRDTLKQLLFLEDAEINLGNNLLGGNHTNIIAIKQALNKLKYLKYLKLNFNYNDLGQNP